MDRRFFLALQCLLVLGAGLTAAAAGTATETGTGTGTRVTIDNFSFNPSRISVPVGTEVIWTNQDDTVHTVTDADHPTAIRSPALDTGDSYARTFRTPGTYRYFCSLHPHMQGTVIVK